MSQPELIAGKTDVELATRMNNDRLMKGVRLLYGAGCHMLFYAVFGYFIAFLAGYDIPRTVDGGSAGSLWGAFIVDVALLAIFALQHSIMARAWFKTWLTRRLRLGLERSTYVLAATLALAVLMWQWRPILLVVWHVDNELGRIVVWVMFYAGWLIALAGTLQIGHGRLFGVRPLWLEFLGREDEPEKFTVSGLYRYVRHPVLVGVLLGMWATPDMTVGHLVLAVGMTVYGLIGTHFEQRDLVRTHGEQYRAYMRRVPAFVPFPKPRWFAK